MIDLTQYSYASRWNLLSLVSSLLINVFIVTGLVSWQRHLLNIYFYVNPGTVIVLITPFFD
jgi:hypothetical protein